MALKNRVQEHRHVAGFTQEALSEKASVSRQTIIAIEKGNYAPSVALALRLAKVLKVAVEDLFKLS